MCGLARWITWIPLLALVAGCATNPFIAVKPAESEGNASAPAKLKLAIDYADRVSSAYTEMLSKEFVRQQNLSAGLLVAGAAALGLAYGKAHRDAIVATALVGGTAYQIGNWNTSSSRSAIFIEGRKSINCARAAFAPLNLSDAELANIRAQVAVTLRAVRGGAQAAGQVKRWLPLVAGEGAVSLQATAQAELNVFAQRYEAANKSITSAGGRERLVGWAGGLLLVHVDKVRILVDSALEGTLAAFTALPKAIGDLGKSVAIFAPGLDLDSALAAKLAAGPAANSPAGSTQKPTAQGGRITGGPGGAAPGGGIDPTDELRKAIAILSAASDELGSQTALLSSGDPLAQIQSALAACDPDFAKAIQPLRLDVQTLDIEAGSPYAMVVAISGGTMPYTSTLLPLKGVSTSFQGAAITITSSGTETTAGTSQVIRIRDATGASVVLNLKVVAKQQPGGLTNAPASQNKPAAKPKPTPTQPKKDVVVTHPAVPPQACVPPESRDACEVGGAQCSFECVSKAKLSAVRARLGFSETPAEYTAEMREKLLSLQKSNGLSPTGHYDQATNAVIEKLPKN